MDKTYINDAVALAAGWRGTSVTYIEARLYAQVGGKIGIVWCEMIADAFGTEPDLKPQRWRVGLWLDCGCCGMDFQIWYGYKDQDQDAGYGICYGCQDDAAQRNLNEENQMIATLRSGLNDDNKIKFDAMDREFQLGLVMKAIEDEMLVFKCVRY
jgi:hypothetical protein